MSNRSPKKDFVVLFKTSFVFALFCFVSGRCNKTILRSISFDSLLSNQLLKDLMVITYSTVL